MAEAGGLKIVPPPEFSVAVNGATEVDVYRGWPLIVEAQVLPQSDDPLTIDFRHPILIEGRKLAALLCTWVNDFYSFEKETLEKDPNNLINVIANDFHLTMDEATTKALEIHRFDYHSFCNLLKHGKDFDLTDRELNYLVGLRYWVDGGLHWTAQTSRYRECAEAMFSQSTIAGVSESRLIADRFPAI